MCAGRKLRSLFTLCWLAATVMLLASPISWTHYWVWIVPALRWMCHALRRRPLGVRIGIPGVVYLFVFAWPLRVDRVGAWDPSMPMVPQGLAGSADRTARIPLGALAIPAR